MYKQIASITALNLKTVRHRWATSSVTVLGVACVVAVFIGMFSIINGFNDIMASSSEPDRMIILGEGASIESQSKLSKEAVSFVENLEYVKRQKGEPIASPEFLWMTALKKQDSGDRVDVAMRGVQSEAFWVRNEIEVIRGRRFQAGLNEIIVGRRTQERFKGLEIGDTLHALGTDWNIVGVFEDRGGIHESEIWLSVHNLQEALPFEEWQRYQSVRIKLKHPNLKSEVQKVVSSNKQIEAHAQIESDYYAQFSEDLMNKMRYVVYPLLVLMGLGAVFAALSTMYNSIDVRAKEIATLRAIGFKTAPINISLLVESIVLAVAGGVVGSLAMYFVFDGYSAATTTANHNTQVEFVLNVTYGLIFKAIGISVLIGLVGAALPAIRLGKMTIIQVLREA